LNEKKVELAGVVEDLKADQMWEKTCSYFRKDGQGRCRRLAVGKTNCCKLGATTVEAAVVATNDNKKHRNKPSHGPANERIRKREMNAVRELKLIREAITADDLALAKRRASSSK
jgi:hypothetical protein